MEQSKIAETNAAKATIVQYDQDFSELSQQNSEDVKVLEGNQEQLALDQTVLAVSHKKYTNSDEQLRLA